MNGRGDGSSVTQVVEEFWGVELTKDKRTAKWDDEDEEDDTMFISNSLELRQACLGPGAKEGERNIVQVIVDDGAGNTSSFSIVSLRAGLAEQATLFLNLQPPVVFKLVEGSGPVNIVGHTTETLDGFGDSEESSDEEEEEEMTLEKGALSLPLKRPANSSSKLPAAKVIKKGKLEDLDASLKSMEDDDDDDEDDEYEDDDDEEDEEDESEEEEEEKPKPIVLKKAQANGKPKTPLKEKSSKLNTVKTPQPQQKTKTQPKGSLSVPPKSAADKKRGGGDKGFDINEIKKKLNKMTVPKKLEKFNNFVGNSFKVKDTAVKKELWEHVQKSRS